MSTEEPPKPESIDTRVDGQLRASDAGEGLAPGADAEVKRVAPPPKPRSGSEPDGSVPRAPASIPAPRAPMIVIGGTPNQHHSSGAAAAWTRPASEPPSVGTLPGGPAKRPSQPGIDLRSKLGIQRSAETASRPIGQSAPARQSRPGLDEPPPSPLGSEPRAVAAPIPSVVSPPLPPTPSVTPGVAAPPPSSPHHAPPLPAFALPEDALREPPLPSFALPIEAPRKVSAPAPAPTPASDRPQGGGRPLPAFSLPEENAPQPLPAFELGDDPTPRPTGEESKPLPAFALSDALEASSVPNPLKEQPGALEAALNAAFPRPPKAAPEPAIATPEPAASKAAPEAAKLEPAPKSAPPQDIEIPVDIFAAPPPPQRRHLRPRCLLHLRPRARFHRRRILLGPSPSQHVCAAALLAHGRAVQASRQRATRPHRKAPWWSTPLRPCRARPRCRVFL
ncbi:MAG: hypothetical protein QM756_36915 [Polyangiaceae bacterium]